MRIVFFGTGDFSVSVATHILNSSHEIVAIVSQPDKVNGRNGKISFNPIKVFANENNIPLYQFEKLNRDGEEVLRKINADLFITASYGQIIKQNILDIPKAIINVHASLLPKYRGSSPIQWAIINGETKTGVTIMKTELGLDCGEMYLKKELDILPTDTSDSVFNRLGTLGGEAIVEFLNNFDYYFNHGEKQNEEEMSYYPMLNKEMSLIDFNNTSKSIVNLIRGLSTCMTAYFIFDGKRYKVIFAHAEEMKDDIVPGTIIHCDSKNGLWIKTLDGSVVIDKIQPEGKGVMDCKAYMNGCKFKVGEKI